MQKQVFVIAGPTGSGKDSIIEKLLERYENLTKGVSAVTRDPRPGEVDGVTYHFMSNERFEREMAAGNIPEHYLRKSINAYYGLYKPDLDARIKEGKVVVYQIQIIGARYLKEYYNATTFFIMPDIGSEFEKRARERAPMSDAEWQERLEFTHREIAEESSWYDYQIKNEEGKLNKAVNEVASILEREGFPLKPAH